MSDVVIVALISFAGTVAGSLIGVLAANKLTNYRLEQLEKKVDKHNSVIERTFELEKQDAILQEEIEHLKEYHK